MKILRLELQQFKRFRLSRIKRFVYTPTTSMQIIVGTNGSGKSSLLDELSPLPGHHSDFEPGGFKEIELVYRKKHYLLRSSFQTSDRHSFLCDGEQLNVGGTYQAQLRLVEDVFGYTQKLHDLLIGRTRFCEMRPAERREWFTLLSQADWEYGLKLYAQVKSKARELQAAYKHQQSRLGQHLQRYETLPTVESLQLQYDAAKEDISNIFRRITPTNINLQQLKPQIEEQAQKLYSTANAFLQQLDARLLSDCDGDTTALEQRLEALRQKEHYHQGQLEQLSNQQHQMAHLLSTCDGQELQSPEALKEQYQQIVQARQAIEQQPAVFEQADAEAVDENRIVLPAIMELLMQLPEQAAVKFPRKKIEEQQQRRQVLIDEIDRLQREQDRAADRLSHLLGQHDTTCPRCQYVWKEGVDPNEILQLEQQIEKRAQTLLERRQELDGTLNYLEDVNAFWALWERFKGYVKSYPRLKPLWDALLEEQRIFTYPAQQQGLIAQWEKDCRRAFQLQDAISKQSKLEQLIELQGSHQQLNLKAYLQQLEQQAQIHTQALHELQQQQQALEERLKAQKLQLERLQIVSATWQQYQRLLEQLAVVVDNYVLEEQAKQVHRQMALLQQQLSDSQTLLTLIEESRQQAQQLQEAQEAYQVLTQILSPVDGLIAAQMRVSVTAIIEQINRIIGMVWSHPMQVLPCQIDSEDLDYKFSVMVDRPDNITSDISRCSKGQMEMINIAFKLTAMSNLHLQDFPLFLDEPGEGFDEQHRERIMSIVAQLMEQGEFSQLFMVSHFASQHGAFSDAHLLALDTSNIALTERFNQDVVLQ